MQPPNDFFAGSNHTRRSEGPFFRQGGYVRIGCYCAADDQFFRLDIAALDALQKGGASNGAVVRGFKTVKDSGSKITRPSQYDGIWGEVK